MQVIERFNHQRSQCEDPTISEDLRSDIEKIFLSHDAIDPGSDLMKLIARPRPFPQDIVGKPFRLQETLSYPFAFKVTLA